MAQPSRIYSGDPSCLRVIGQPGTSQQMNPTISRCTPFLEIIEQPEKFNQFRYISELAGNGMHGSLKGMSKNSGETSPAVALRNFPYKAWIRCSPYQFVGREEDRAPHSHFLVRIRNNVPVKDPHFVEVSSANKFVAVFDKMGVLKTKIEDIPEVLPLKIKTIREQDESRQLTPDEMKQIQLDAENESKMNINKICLRFQAYEMKGDALVQIAGCKPVYSNVINDSKGPGAELKIFRLSTNESSVMGGQEVFVLVSKVSLASIKVKFFENYDNGDRLWEAYGTFVEVHRQFAIVLKTPPYRNPSISSRTKVQVQLVRVEADGVPESVSKPFDFFYNPKPQSVSTQTENPASNIQPEVSSACAIPVALNDPIDIQEVTSQAIEYPPATDQSQSSPSVHIFEQTFYNVNPESDQLLSGILAFYPTDMSPNLFQVLGSSPEELNRYLGEGDDDDDYGNSRMETDCRGRDANHNRKINFSLLSKLSALVKLFKKSYDDKELHEMLVDITSSHVRSNKKIFLSIIRHGSAADIRTLAVILINFKLLEFMTKSNEANQNVLHLLIKKRHGTLLKELLDFFGTAKLQIDLNQVDVRGRTPLHVAISKGDEEAVRVLLCCHVDLSVADKKGFLPVHLAVSSSNLPILKLLVEAGADVEAQHLLTGDNVLHMAVQADKIFMDMLKYLIAQDEFLLQQINNLEMNVLQLAIFGEKPASLISFLSSFYDDLPLKSESSTGDERNEEDTSMFDIQCKQKLCGILDESGEWKNIVTLMALEDKIFDGQNEASPTNTLIKYFEMNRTRAEDFFNLLKILGHKKAMLAIDEMTARKFDK